jgi:hypothetical protein
MKTLHASGNYAAYQHPVAGLIIQSTRKAGGVRMAPDHPQYEEYVDAFETAIDVIEADSLCKALLN